MDNLGLSYVEKIPDASEVILKSMGWYIAVPNHNKTEKKRKLCALFLG